MMQKRLKRLLLNIYWYTFYSIKTSENVGKEIYSRTQKAIKIY